MHDEWISFWAKFRPDNVAVILRSGAVRYVEFDAQINKVAARLQALGIRPGGRVAVHQPDDYVHWLLVLALDRLGLPSMSIGNPALQKPILSALGPDLLLAADGSPTTGVPSLAITRQWYDETMAMPASAPPVRKRQPDEIVRFFASTGTTGKPKLMAVTRRQVLARVDGARLAMATGLQRRGCTLMGMVTSGGYTWPLCYWSGGGSNILNVGFSESPAEALRRARPTQLVLSVGTLLELVRGPAASLPPMPSLEVFVTGSVLPRALADEARRVLSTNLNVFYATTEMSGIAMGSTSLLQQHEGTAGYLLPGVEVEAVDEGDRPLPLGTTGILRMRSDAMISRYLGEDPAAGNSSFRNGWFYPGDLGSLSADGVVAVAGRTTEVLNIAGNKFQPAALEEQALACAGIRDAAAFSVPDDRGIETPWIAVVRGEDHRPGEVVTRIRTRWPLIGNLQVAVTREIPRNHMGKIDRVRLRQQVKEWKASHV